MRRTVSPSGFGFPAHFRIERKGDAAKVENDVREKLTLAFDTLLVLSWQMVFRVMHLARRLNY